MGGGVSAYIRVGGYFWVEEWGETGQPPPPLPPAPAVSTGSQPAPLPFTGTETALPSGTAAPIPTPHSQVAAYISCHLAKAQRVEGGEDAHKAALLR